MAIMIGCIQYTIGSSASQNTIFAIRSGGAIVAYCTAVAILFVPRIVAAMFPHAETSLSMHAGSAQAGQMQSVAKENRRLKDALRRVAQALGATGALKELPADVRDTITLLDGGAGASNIDSNDVENHSSKENGRGSTRLSRSLTPTNGSAAAAAGAGSAHQPSVRMHYGKTTGIAGAATTTARTASLTPSAGQIATPTFGMRPASSPTVSASPAPAEERSHSPPVRPSTEDVLSNSTGGSSSGSAGAERLQTVVEMEPRKYAHSGSSSEILRFHETQAGAADVGAGAVLHVERNQV
jgi:hypothetical protein